MKDFFKGNGVIVLALVLPVIFILIIALRSYLPSLGVKTDYDFLYASCGNGDEYAPDCNYYLTQKYKIVNGRLVENPVQEPVGNPYPGGMINYQSHIFVLDTESGESREVTLAKAQELNLSELLTSPDGVTVSGEYNRGSGFFLFDGGSSYGYYLRKGNRRSEFHPATVTDRYYRNNFRFLGWIIAPTNRVYPD